MRAAIVEGGDPRGFRSVFPAGCIRFGAATRREAEDVRASRAVSA